jgi:hexosaminidase
MTIKTVAEKGYKMIFSNYDALYLDCGFENYVGLGNNWCSPYKSNIFNFKII